MPLGRVCRTRDCARPRGEPEREEPSGSGIPWAGVEACAAVLTFVAASAISRPVVFCSQFSVFANAISLPGKLARRLQAPSEPLYVLVLSPLR